LALLLTAVCGCAGNHVYRAVSLPPELDAPPVVNAQVLDLSRFAGPPTSSERINPGDVLEVSIAAGLGSDDVTTFPVRVTDTGMAVMPEIGQLALAGMDLGDAEQAVAAACLHRQLYREPHVTVTMKRPRRNRVTVIGAVEKPGVYELANGASYLLEAIVAAGGLAEDAGTNVEIRRPYGSSALVSSPDGVQAGVRLASGAERTDSVDFKRIDLAEVVRHGGTDEYLPDSSAVMIERRQPHPIEVLGLVRKPGQYELPPNQELRVLGAIALTGGLSNAMADKVYVLRTDPQTGKTAVIELSVKQAKRNREENIRLAPGDIVSVERTPSTLVMDALNFVRVNVGGSIPLF
jgi:polysaccharide export outer membrane protein